MAISLTWIRDNFDTNKNRYIDADEGDAAKSAWLANTISTTQFGAVLDAYNKHTQLPAYGAATSITCTRSTPHFTNGCELLKKYDSNNNGVLTQSEVTTAATDWSNSKITNEEMDFVEAAYTAGSINAMCSGCHSASAPPGTISLEEGKSYPIQVSLSGYDTVNATIRVSATGVSCTSGPCSTSGLPRVTASGWSVSVHLKKTAASSTNRCGWIDTKDTTKVAFISEMVMAYAGVPPGIGFVPSASDIGGAVLMYMLNKTPSETWGC